MLLEFYARVVGDTGVRKSRAYCKSWLLDKSNGKVHWRAFWCVFCTNFVKIIPFGFLLWKALQVIIFDAVEWRVSDDLPVAMIAITISMTIHLFQFAVLSGCGWRLQIPCISVEVVVHGFSIGRWFLIVFVEKLNNVFPICTWWSMSSAKPSIIFVVFCFIRLIWVLRP